MPNPPLKSWLPSPPDSEFPIQNLPYGIFRQAALAPRAGVAIGETVLDLAALHNAGCFAQTPFASKNIFASDTLNDFMELGRAVWAEVRARVSSLLAAEGDSALRDNPELRAAALMPQSEVEMLLPARIGDYTDFYASEHHAANVGRMFRGPENPLLPNWKHLPVGYHGRTSSIIPSGEKVIRPYGQILPKDSDRPIFAPTRELDFELEIGFLTGPGNPLGTPIPIRDAREHIFGLVLLNDWSARDMQRWEYRPLGPFLAKSFATSISPWVVTLDALEPFRVPGPAQDPHPLPYLQTEADWAFDLHLEVWLQTVRMAEPVRISKTNFRTMYWNIAQMLAHQTSNGVNVRPGDLYGSGTVSGPTEDSRGSLLELTWQGKQPLQLPTGEARTFLEDGDTVIFRGYCQGDGYRVGFGELRATVLPAIPGER
jgi:fumarylacetoacetase